ncbi:MAG: SpoIVB peptidase S55 domain-containing protein [Oscillospiraceae bacterium]
MKRCLPRQAASCRGCPAAQSCKTAQLVGAVTHVLVNSPAQGYGILIDRMLQAAEG